MTEIPPTPPGGDAADGDQQPAGTGWFKPFTRGAMLRIADREWMRGCLAIMLVALYAGFGGAILASKPSSNVVIALLTATSSLVTAAVAFFFGTRGKGGGD